MASQLSHELDLQSLPDLPPEPNQPSATFSFPKRSFGQKKPVQCSAHTQWFHKWKFLHYDEAQDIVFCHTCVRAFQLRRIKFSRNASTAFVSRDPDV